MGERRVTVATGDTLWAVSKRALGAGHRWPEIFALNRDTIRDPNIIRIGQNLRLPEHRRSASDPHPLQRTRPHIAPLGSTPATIRSTSDLGRPSTVPGHDPVASTTVNNVAIKFDLRLVKPVTMPIPGGTATLSWAGQVYLWRDGQRPLATVGNRGLELSEKKHASIVLGDLLESRKLTVGLDRRVTYEDLMGVVSYGAPDTVVSGGVVVTSTSPALAWRTQVKTKLRQGRFRDWLFIAEDITVNFDISMDPSQPPANPPLPQAVPVPVAGRTPVPGRITGNLGAQPTALQEVGRWTVAHKQEILVGALVVASVALAFLTLGGSAAVEGGLAVLGAAARQAALAAARPALVAAVAGS